MNTETLLHEEIQTEFEKLREMEAGSEPYKVTVDGLTKLVDREIELKKIEEEGVRHNTQTNVEKRDRWIKNGIAIASLVVPTAVTIWGTLKSLKFEEEGTVTTIMGRGFINKLLPKK